MILGDKIIHLRKKFEMTQEELAEKLNVSRQSVSKWEGSLSTPDLNKVIAMSKVFGVSTDYLLNDEIGKEDIEASESSDEGWLSISLEQANVYLREYDKIAHIIALAVVIFICSVIPLIFFSSEIGQSLLAANMAEFLGLMVLIIGIASGVGMLIWNQMHTRAIDKISEQSFELEYGVEGFLEKEQESYRPSYIRSLTLGIVLIIIDMAPLIGVGSLFPDFMDANGGLVVAVWLLVLAIALFIIIRSSIYWSSINTLLDQNGQPKMTESDMDSKVASVYWPIVVALYLGYSFITNDWGRSWIIWPVAGLLFAAVTALANIVSARGNGK